MPRTSRKKFITNTDNHRASVKCKYIVGAYIRISKEDNEQDSSIVNQEATIKAYVDNNSDMQIHKIYIDNGVSSFNPVRKAFDEMIADIDIGTINCVVAKDLSRFGRDYMETGYYVETVFSLKNVRFIAILDNYDSFRLTNANDPVLMAIKSVMNTQYSKDISKKVKSVVMNKMKQGNYVPAFLPYGYKKQYNNKTCKFVIDDNVSGIIERIFESACNGMGSFYIAGMLNKDGIVSPGTYKHENGLKSKSSLTKWSKYIVDDILRNRTYIGEMVCNKTSNSLINRGVKKLDESDRIIISDHHDPIVSVDVFEKAQELFVKNKGRMKSDSSKPKSNFEYYQKDLYCGDCGRKMRKRIWKGKTYFICPRYEEARGLCSIKSIRDDILKAKIYESIKQDNDAGAYILTHHNSRADLSHEMYKFFVDRVHVYDDNNIRLQYKNYEKVEKNDQH